MRTFYADVKGVPEYINLMEDNTHKSICRNLAVSDAIKVTITMQSIYAAREFETETYAWEKRAFNAKGWEEQKQHFLSANESHEHKKISAPNSNQFCSANNATQLNRPPRRQKSARRTSQIVRQT